MREHSKSGALTEVTFFILLALFRPRHGYSIMQFIEEKTKGRLTLGAGTLYGAIVALEEKGFISPYGNCKGRKKEYLITDLGREVCQREAKRLRQVLETAEAIMEERYE